MEVVLTLLNDSNLPKIVWGETLMTTTYLQNQSPSNVIQSNKTHYQLWIGHKPKLSNLWMFGCQTFVSFWNSKEKK